MSHTAISFLISSIFQILNLSKTRTNAYLVDIYSFLSLSFLKGGVDISKNQVRMGEQIF